MSETPDSELGRLAASLGPDAEKAYMTTAEMIKTRGRASIAQVEKWTTRAVTVHALDEVFD